MTQQLVGDIGGTKTFLRFEDKKTGYVYEGCYSTPSFASLTALVQLFLIEVTKKLDEKLLLKKACLAVPGPVIDNTSMPPLLGWKIDAKYLEQELDIERIYLINDFEAISYGVLKLNSSDLCSLQTGVSQTEALIGVIGAGTGLGYSFLLRQGHSYQVYPSEGAHADFAPRSDLEFQLLQYLREKFNVRQVPVYRVVSGPGILAIYQFLRDRRFAPESPPIGQLVRNWQQNGESIGETSIPVEAIASAALKKSDHLCEKTMQIFVEAYGAEAGNFALRLLPYGGLFVAGGIATKILPLIQESSFLRAFIGQSSLSSLLERIPIYIVLNPQVGLMGASIYAANF